jgi:hypothetical protein
MATIAGANNNPVPRRNIYPTSSGPTIGGAASTLSPYDTAAMGGASGSATLGANGGVASSGAVAAATAAASKGFLGQPLTWFLLLLALLISLRFVAGKLGEGDDFKNIRVTVHNVIVISLAAIIGIGFFKVVFNYWKVPGLTTYINAV